ncbi:hypothetical protein [Streptomyces sp. 7N604]|uniref:hypothetical protein n=1 Tax=Streptomyces sp. 7N604 TaxID=3457415 RepID=UPI003FD4DBC2
MSDIWDEVRAGWEAAVRAAEGTGHPQNEEYGAGRAGLGLARRPIAFTGEPGAGKTVLFDALAQRVGPDDDLKGRSPDREEKHTVFMLGSMRIRVSVMVVPGQESAQRERAMNRVLSDNAAPEGIIHVVCWGHNKVWDRRGQNALEDGVRGAGTGITPDAVREWHLLKERRDFEDLCDRIKETRAVERRLKWLIVAVTKSDLFWNDIDSARDYYIPDGDATGPGDESRFCTALRDLAEGSRLRIAVVPVSSRLLRHSFGGGLPPRMSVLDELGARGLRKHFYRTLKGLL